MYVKAHSIEMGMFAVKNVIFQKAQQTADWDSTAYRKRRAICEGQKRKKRKEGDEEGTATDARAIKQN